VKKVTITFLVESDDPIEKLVSGAQEIDDALTYLFGENYKGGLSFDAIECSEISYEVRGFYIPSYTFQSLKAYIEKHQPTGHFLAAILSNDLLGAVERADSINIRNLPAYVFYLYNEAPTICWGSKEKVERWLEYESD